MPTPLPRIYDDAPPDGDVTKVQVPDSKLLEKAKGESQRRLQKQPPIPREEPEEPAVDRSPSTK
jgi:hypothetical protein